MRFLLLGIVVGGCYTGAPANRDVGRSWERRSRAEREDRWGAPAARDRDPQTETAYLTYTFARTHLVAPSASLAIGETRTPTAAVVDIGGAFHPGAIVRETTAAVAAVDPASDAVAKIDGAALHWGPPNDANLHWGVIYGAHVGMGGLDTTSTPLPSGGAYLGGMLSPTVGLVGTFDLVAGTSDRGGAMGFAGGIGAVWWPVNRLAFRAGPALLLTLRPGFTDPALAPGAAASASYAVIKIGVLALGVRADVVAGPSTVFGSVGVGIDVN